MKQFPKLFFMLLFASMVSLNSCGNKSEAENKASVGSSEDKAPVPVPKIEGWAIYENDGIIFQYPADWKMNEEGVAGADFTLFAPQGKGEIGDNINLVHQDVQGIALQQYVDLSVKGIETTDQIDDVKIEKKEKGNIYGKDFFDLGYSGVISEISMRWRQRIYLVDGTAYIFTFTGQGDPEGPNFKEASKIFDTFDLEK